MNVYFDNASTTKVDETILDAASDFCKKWYYNPSSKYDLGKKSKEKIEEMRQNISKEINCEPEEIIFTSGATESNNFALLGLAKANPEKRHIVVSAIEHPSILETCKVLEKEGYDVAYITVNSEGVVDVKEIEKRIRSDTLLVSVMHVNNETGVIQPIEEIGKICKEKNVYFHSDCVQSFKKFDIDVKKDNLTMISVSGHKVHVPKGIGFLYVKLGTKIKPIIDGGGQEFKLRSGTENVLGIYCLGEISDKDLKNESIDGINAYIRSEIEKIEKVKINSIGSSSYIINVSFYGIEGEALMDRLSKEGIYVSTGSSCSSNKIEESHVLSAMNVDELYINGSIRISLSRYSTMEEATYFIPKLVDIVSKLRDISPFSIKE